MSNLFDYIIYGTILENIIFEIYNVVYPSKNRILDFTWLKWEIVIDF